jgi:hypothetical protein
VNPVGVDRVSCSFPLEGFQEDRSAWSEVRARQVAGAEIETFSGAVDVAGVKVFVGVSEQPEAHHRWWGKVELNPSRVVDPEGVSLAPVEELPGVMRRVREAALELLSPVEPLREWRTKRVDVARDFGGVSDAAVMVRSLAPIPRPWSRRNLVHADPVRSGAQTLMVGSGAGVARLYDKHVESGGVAPDGTLRCEFECRAGWLERYGGIARLGDVNAESVSALARDRWEWSAMGVEVSGDWSLVFSRCEAAGLTPERRRAFIGFLVEQAEGHGVSMGKNQATYYRRLQRLLGVTAPSGGGGLRVMRRLDFDSGTEVCRVA